MVKRENTYINNVYSNDAVWLDDIIRSSEGLGTTISTTPVTVSFNETTTEFTESDITISSGTLSNFTGSDNTYTFNR